MNMKIRSHYKAPIRQLGEDVEGYVLDEIDGKTLPQGEVKCVLSKRGFASVLGLKGGGSAAVNRALSAKGIGPLIPKNLRKKLDNPIIFKYLPGGPEKSKSSGYETHGYETETIIEVMKFILEAQGEGLLTAKQSVLAEKAKTLLISLANTTLDVLIYQESGFWQASEGQKLSQILEKYLLSNAKKWAKTFPDDFWHKLIKMKGFPSYIALKRPAYVGHWVNDIIYDRLAPGVKIKLNELNPRNTKGRRPNKHHQYLTEDHGVPELKEHLTKVMTLMDASPNKENFERMLNRALPKYGENIAFDFED